MISVIIPVYNGGKFILRCYESLCSQVLKEIEFIFVNDGSTDNSLVVLRELADLDNRVKVISQENKGALIARNIGVANAKNEYIVFLDVDDVFINNSLSHFLYFLDESVDILISPAYGRPSHVITANPFVDYTRDQYLHKLLISGGWELWSKIFRKTLFINLLNEKLPKIKIGEDALVLVHLVLMSSKIRFISSSFYKYNQHSESASNIKSIEYAIDGIKASELIEEKIIKEGLSFNHKEALDAMSLLFYSNSLRRGYIQDKSIINGVKKRLNINSLKLIGLKKSVFVMICLYGGSNVHRFLRKFM